MLEEAMRSETGLDSYSNILVFRGLCCKSWTAAAPVLPKAGASDGGDESGDGSLTSSKECWAHGLITVLLALLLLFRKASAFSLIVREGTLNPKQNPLKEPGKEP